MKKPELVGLTVETKSKNVVQSRPGRVERGCPIRSGDRIHHVTAGQEVGPRDEYATAASARPSEGNTEGNPRAFRHFKTSTCPNPQNHRNN